MHFPIGDWQFWAATAIALAATAWLTRGLVRFMRRSRSSRRSSRATLTVRGKPVK